MNDKMHYNFKPMFDALNKDTRARVLLEKLGYTYIESTWQLKTPKTLMQVSPAYLPLHPCIGASYWEEEGEVGVGSFDELVFTWNKEDVLWLIISQLSEDQNSFFLKYLKANSLWVTYGDNTQSPWRSYVLDENGLVWGCDDVPDLSDKVTTFNNVFKHKSEV